MITVAYLHLSQLKTANNMTYTVTEKELRSLAKDDRYYLSYLDRGDIQLFTFNGDSLEIHDLSLFLKYLGLSVAAIARLAWIFGDPCYYSSSEGLKLSSYRASKLHKQQYADAINKFNQLINK